MLDIPFYIIVGCFSGFISGLLGVGGGTVVVPVLSMIFLNQQLPFPLIMHMAIGSSLMIMLITSQSVVRTYAQRGYIEWAIFRRFLPGIFIGTVLGVVIAQHLSTQILSTLLGAFLFIIAVRMFFLIKPAHNGLPGSFLHNIVSVMTGLVSGLLGLGGGIITIPYLTRHNISMHNAVGLSSACSLIMAAVGTVACMLTGLNAEGLPAYSTGYIYWPAVIGIALPSMLCTPFGAGLSERLSVNFLKRLFACFLLTVAIKMI